MIVPTAALARLRAHVERVHGGTPFADVVLSLAPFAIGNGPPGSRVWFSQQTIIGNFLAIL